MTTYDEYNEECLERNKRLNPENYIDVSTKQGVNDFIYAKGNQLGITIEGWTVNDDLSVDASTFDIGIPNRAGLFLTDENGKHYLKVKFSKVKNFTSYFNFLYTTKNFPEQVFGHFNVTDCRLSSAIGGPRKVRGYCSYANNRLKTIEGLPEFVGMTLDIAGNKSIKHLKDIHKIVKSCRTISLPGKIKSNILGLILIEDLAQIRLGSKEKIINPGLTQAIEIMNKHLLGNRDILECQEELIVNGLKEYAKL
jgi:hypothetical protein